MWVVFPWCKDIVSGFVAASILVLSIYYYNIY